MRIRERDTKSQHRYRLNNALGAGSAQVGVIPLHQIRSQACGAAALDCIQSRYTFVFFVDSQNRKSKTIIVL
jgi:hypothetical protein